MKKITNKLVGGMLLLSVSMSLTSCEGALDDILGEWSRPTPGSSTGGAVAVTGIDLDADEMKLAAGDKGQLTAKVDPAGAAVTWSSDKEEIATVDENGMVTAVAMGTAIITAKAGDKTAICEVTVTPGLSTPLTLEAITAGTIVVYNPQAGMQYSLNGGAKQAVTTVAITVAVGDKVQFYGNSTNIKAYYSDDSEPSNDTNISGGSAQVKVYGNIMSLVDETDFASKTELPENNTFRNLFSGNAKLTDASGLLLPATTLADHCYRGMFQGCTGLTTLPEKLLPATTLAALCYQNMFYQCTSLTTIPEALLPATTLTDRCYQNMFENCTGLTTLPEKLLPATTLTDQCYLSMFQGCTGLTTLPEKLLPATEMKPSCYASMFYQCTGLTTLPEKLLPATNLAVGCYISMFYGCTGLTTLPEKLLPAETLADYCYSLMFYGCNKLTTAPALPATTLAEASYLSMFENCTGLTTTPKLPAPTLTKDCYCRMFYGCTSLNAVTCLATNLTASDCTSNWLDGAGTDASVTSRTLHIKTGQSTTDPNWKLDTSGDGSSNKWTAVADQ